MAPQPDRIIKLIIIINTLYTASHSHNDKNIIRIRHRMRVYVTIQSNGHLCFYTSSLLTTTITC